MASARPHGSATAGVMPVPKCRLVSDRRALGSTQRHYPSPSSRLVLLVGGPSDDLMALARLITFNEATAMAVVQHRKRLSSGARIQPFNQRRTITVALVLTQ